MRPVRPWLLVAFALLAGSSASGAEIAVATLVDGNARLLRATTWHKLVPGARVEEGDIVEAGERGQVQLEFAVGSIASFVGPGALYVVPPAAKPRIATGAPVLLVPGGWFKVAAKEPGLQVRAASAEVTVVAGTVVLRTDGTRLDIFVESGNARIAALAPSGAEDTARDAKHDEYWSKSASGAFVPSTRPPKAFVDAMPRHYFDALPSFAGKFKTRPTLAADREITYSEAEPWLAGRDRAVFERRFASRLRDPAFRRAVEPDVARYPTWDRRLHPEKYAPPPVPKPPAPP
jgi:hypothetical protein